MTDRSLDSHQLSQLSQAAAEREADLAAQLRETAEERAKLEAKQQEVAATEAARAAHLERCRVDFVKAADTLMTKKLSTPVDYVALVRAIVAARIAFRDAATDFDGNTDGDRRSAEFFVQRITNSHPTTAVMLWLQPLLNVQDA